ncbi:unnamed protein product [Cylindrotheca closterium]|uniref:Uncharacterized protein n=1 Tax=Cylindrotheca closterium TaxID=2856 RepID=A0AAD2CAV3_9STRA|nr:unnamed protein product [Cylindrotheca closterium]
MTKNQITFLIPDNVSSIPPSDALFLTVTKAGIVWHELAPILLRSSPKTVAKLLRLLQLSSKTTRSKILSSSDETTSIEKGEQDDDDKKGESDKNVVQSSQSSQQEDNPHPGFRFRRLLSRSLPSFTLVLVPPTSNQSPDATFLSVVLRTEHRMLKLQTLSAVLSTLGGGYFFCKHLSISLVLARQQRALAYKLGHIGMVRQCTVNEAYNLIYAGRFGEAKRVLTQLEASLIGSDDETTRNQCHAARLFAKRLKQVAAKGTLKQYNPNDVTQSHTVDDFQRIRIVAA